MGRSSVWVMAWWKWWRGCDIYLGCLIAEGAAWLGRNRLVKAANYRTESAADRVQYGLSLAARSI